MNSTVFKPQDELEHKILRDEIKLLFVYLKCFCHVQGDVHYFKNRESLVIASDCQKFHLMLH